MSNQVNIGQSLLSALSDLTTSLVKTPVNPSDKHHHQQTTPGSTTVTSSGEHHSSDSQSTLLTTLTSTVPEVTSLSQLVQITVNLSSFSSSLSSSVTSHTQITNQKSTIILNTTKSESPLLQFFDYLSSLSSSSPTESILTNLDNLTNFYSNVTNDGASFINDSIIYNDYLLKYGSSTSISPINTSFYDNLANLTSNWTIPLNGTTNLSLPVLTTNWTTEPDLRIHHPFLAIFLGIICLLVMFGNILIMVAIRRERYLHTVTNLFVASLAVADCLVGAIVMPSSVVHEVMNKWWVFGQDWCDLWHSFDVLASTASILNLCVISLDRYWAITDPISYPARMTPRKAKILIALVWACSALISFPAILWWRAVSDPPRPLRCDFTEDIGYLVFSSIISFYGPLLIMLVVYFRIYRAAVQQTKSVKAGTKSIASLDGTESAVVLRIHRGGGGGGVRRWHKEDQCLPCASSASGSSSCDNNNEGHLPTATTTARGRLTASEVSFDESTVDYLHHHHPSHPDENGLSVKVSSVRHRNMKAFSLSRKLAKLAKEKKAAKTLGIVMGVFILCWLPFFIANLVKGFCGDACLINPDLVYPLVTWLGWLNSGMNPVIYACWSRDFRRAFKKILCYWYKPSHRSGIKTSRPGESGTGCGYITHSARYNNNYSLADVTNNRLPKTKQKSPKCHTDSLGMIGLTSGRSSLAEDKDNVEDIFFLTQK